MRVSKFSLDFSARIRKIKRFLGDRIGAIRRVLVPLTEVRILVPQPYTETFEKCSISFKIKAREDFNHRNILNILRIKI